MVRCEPLSFPFTELGQSTNTGFFSCTHTHTQNGQLVGREDILAAFDKKKKKTGVLD